MESTQGVVGQQGRQQQQQQQAQPVYDIRNGGHYGKSSPRIMDAPRLCTKIYQRIMMLALRIPQLCNQYE
jgi:hypothetical protein